ncbi:MAG: WD40 repeat domain-containing protein [Thermoguttaceae bacterium]
MLSEKPSANTTQTPPQPKQKRKRRVLLAAICMGVLLFYGTMLYQRLMHTWQTSKVIPGFVDYGSHTTRFSPDGALIAIAHCGNSKILDWVKGAEISSLEQYNGQGIAAFSSNGRIISYFRDKKTNGRQACFWKASSGRLLGQFRLPEQFEDDRCFPFFSADNKKIVAVCGDGLITWDLSDLNNIGHIKISRNSDSWLSTFMSWHPITHEMTAVDANGKLLKVDLQTQSTVPLLAKQAEAIEAANWSPDGKRLVTVDRQDGSVSIWDVSAGTVLTKLPEKEVVSAYFSPDGKKLVTEAKRYDVVHSRSRTPLFWDRRTCIWDARSGKLVEELPSTAFVTFSPDWSFWVDAGPEGLRIAKFDGSELCAYSGMFDGHGSTCTFSKDNQWLAYVNGSGLVVVLQHNPIHSWYECLSMYETWMIVLSVVGLTWCVKRRKSRNFSHTIPNLSEIAAP